MINNELGKGGAGFYYKIKAWQMILGNEGISRKGSRKKRT